ncbi:MAG: hypothetical protein ACFFDF_00255 [Candidatus Odinarchaeota archaeon]
MKKDNRDAINYAIGVLKQLKINNEYEAVSKAINGLEVVLKTEKYEEGD